MQLTTHEDAPPRTPSPKPLADPVTPEPKIEDIDGTAASAQDLINRMLGGGSTLPLPPTTPNNWKAGASTDLAFNTHKAPSPLTPFARPPADHKSAAGTQLRYPPRTPFRTPPPRLRTHRHRNVSDSESRPEVGLTEGSSAGEASGSSSFRTPQLQAQILSSGGPDYGLRDMFGLSPLKTPLAHRTTGIPSGTNVSPELALYKRSLLPPSPFRTPTSSSRYTRPGDDDDDGIDHNDSVNVDAAFDDGHFIEGPVTGSGGNRRARRHSASESYHYMHGAVYDPSAHAAADELARLQEAPVTPLGSSTLFGRSGMSQSPGMSPGAWRMY